MLRRASLPRVGLPSITEQRVEQSDSDDDGDLVTCGMPKGLKPPSLLPRKSVSMPSISAFARMSSLTLFDFAEAKRRSEVNDAIRYRELRLRIHGVRARDRRNN